MNHYFLPQRVATLALILSLGSLPALSQAQAVYHVSVDTSHLATGYSTPLSLDFQFLDSGDPSNNTVTVTNFTYGAGGSAPADDSGAATTGTAFGGLASGTVSLADDAFFNELYQPFTPGSALNFDVTLSTNPDTSAGSSPDAFVFSILDTNLTPLSTQDPSGADSLVAIDIDSPTPTAASYATNPDANGFTVKPTVAPVPELSSAIALPVLFGLAGASILRRRARVA